MKKRLFLCMVLLLTLCACQSTFRVERSGVIYQVDQTAQTVTQGGNVYQYHIQPLVSDIPTMKKSQVTITYPNGGTYSATYTLHEVSTHSTMTYISNDSVSADYDPDRYVSGRELVAVVTTKSPASLELLFQFLLLAILAVVVVYANFAWYGRIRLWRKAYKEQHKDE